MNPLIAEPIGIPSECLLLKNMFDPATKGLQYSMVRSAAAALVFAAPSNQRPKSKKLYRPKVLRLLISGFIVTEHNPSYLIGRLVRNK
ncbi:hypothetical protein AgCh_010135 [Apium graveolens]